jgi:Lon-like ATP-dependent protease
MEDVFIEERYRKKIEIIPVKTLSDVLEYALKGKGKNGLLEKMKKITEIVPQGILKQPTTH